MNLERRCCVALLALVGLAVGSREVAAAPLKGDNEVQGSLAFSMINGTSEGQLATTFHYGRYLVPWFELGVRQSAAYTFRDKLSDRWLFATEPFFDFLYNVDPTQIAVPYIGSTIGAAYNDNGAAGVVAPEVGIKFFLDQQTYVGLAYDYQFFFNDLDDTFKNGQNQVRAQFGFLWGSDRTSAVAAAAQRVEGAAKATEDAAGKVDSAASKVGSAADRTENAADSMAEQFKRGLQK